jgi:hypothetical protein
MSFAKLLSQLAYYSTMALCSLGACLLLGGLSLSLQLPVAALTMVFFASPICGFGCASLIRTAAQQNCWRNLGDGLNAVLLFDPGGLAQLRQEMQRNLVTNTFAPPTPLNLRQQIRLLPVWLPSLLLPGDSPLLRRVAEPLLLRATLLSLIPTVSALVSASYISWLGLSLLTCLIGLQMLLLSWLLLQRQARQEVLAEFLCAWHSGPRLGNNYNFVYSSQIHSHGEPNISNQRMNYGKLDPS